MQCLAATDPLAEYLVTERFQQDLAVRPVNITEIMSTLWSCCAGAEKCSAYLGGTERAREKISVDHVWKFVSYVPFLIVSDQDENVSLKMSEFRSISENEINPWNVNLLQDLSLTHQQKNNRKWGGTSGAATRALAAFLQRLWLNRYEETASKEFKTMIGDYNPDYRSCAQHVGFFSLSNAKNLRKIWRLLWANCDQTSEVSSKRLPWMCSCTFSLPVM